MEEPQQPVSDSLSLSPGSVKHVFTEGHVSLQPTVVEQGRFGLL